MIPVAVGEEVDPDQLPISPVVTDPSPDLGKPDKLVIKIMARVFVGKILVGASLKRERHRFFRRRRKKIREGFEFSMLVGRGVLWPKSFVNCRKLRNLISVFLDTQKYFFEKFMYLIVCAFILTFCAL